MPAKVFISYSHKDSQDKEQLLSQLQVLEREGSLGPIEAWDDSRIGLGEDWKSEIEAALNDAHIAILLVTAHFLTSDFILQEEVRVILDRHKRDLVIIPIIARDCAWQEIQWLAKLNVFNGGTPVWEDGNSHVDRDLANIAREVADYAKRLGAPPQQTAQPSISRYAHILFISLCGEDDDVSQAGPPFFGRWFRQLFLKRQEAYKPAMETSKLLGVVREEISNYATDASGLLVCYGAHNGVVVAAFDDPQQLFQFSLFLATRLKERAVPYFRMGLHSAAVESQAPTDSAGVPVKAIDIARRVMELGYNGHLLSSGAAKEFLRDIAGLESQLQIDPAPRREIAPLTSCEVYNFHNAKVGNSRRPRPKVPERIASKITIPKSIQGLRQASIKMIFWPTLPYVKVQFQVEKSGNEIRISCEKPEGKDCTFEFDFENLGDNRKQIFKIIATNPVEDSFFDFKVSCRDELGDLITTPVERRILLYRKQPPPKDYKDIFNLFLWLKDLFWFSPGYLKTAILVLACLVGYWFVPEQAKIRLRLWPSVMTEIPSITFKKSGDDTTQYWEVSGGELKLEEGLGGTLDGALVVTGPRIMFLRSDLLRSKSFWDRSKEFYDFKVEIAIKLKPGTTKAGWIFRARPCNRNAFCGYLFVVEKTPEGPLLLHGTIVDDDISLSSDTPDTIDRLGPPRPIPLGTYDANDWIYVIATVNEYVFRHDVQIRAGTDTGTDTAFQLVGPDFSDKDGRSFRSGNVGLWEPEGNEMVVDRWVMYRVGHLNSSDASAGKLQSGLTP